MSKLLLTFLFIFSLHFPLLAQEVDTAWIRRYNGPGNDYDVSIAIAVDISGNVYVTGQSDGSGTSRDYATIKYYPNGDTAWVRRYNGPENYSDQAYAMAVDDSGSVFVTGKSLGNGTDYDYVTIKYYSNGDTAWVRRYNGPGNLYDWARAIVLDDSGRVYITGMSFGNGTAPDYATIKYHPNGDTAWVRRYNGPGNSEDWAFDIALDDSGNVYVTGFSYGSGTYEDYATIKYYPNGDTAWVRRYNGPGNYNDEANSIVADASGSVYVTGYSFGNGTFADYATIKYYSNGDTAWVRRYDGPGNYSDEASAITVDASGDLCVTGWSYGSGTNNDYATIKYYSNGDTAWVRRYNGEGKDFHDYAITLTVDVSGDLYVTGWSYNDYTTIKYYSNGDSAWVGRYNGPENGWDGAHAIATDVFGSVYVTGGSSGIGTGSDYATIKYIQFLRGDADGDNSLSLTDIVYLINYLFKRSTAPYPLKAGDCNCDGSVTIADIVRLIAHLFKGGPPPGC